MTPFDKSPRWGRSDASHAAFSLSRGAAFYVALLIFAVIFTQALRSPVSVVFLWFVAMLPAISVFYALIGRASVGAFALSDETTTEKMRPVGFEFRVSNYSVLPLPFTEAEIFLPTENGVSCESRLVGLSLLPRGEYYFKSDVTFKYRGSYRVGVGCVYVSDMLRIFRFRRRVNIYTVISVMPRRLVFSREDTRSPSDAPTDSRIADGAGSSETNLIRDYRGGDPLKHIHWKLSSKMQDLQVNDYKPNSGKNVCVFCDFASLFSDSAVKKKERKPARPAAKKKSSPRVVRVRFPGDAKKRRMTADETLEQLSEQTADKARAALAVAKSRQEIVRKLLSVADGDVGAGPNDDMFDRADELLPECIFDHDEFCADGVSELAVGVVMNELEQSNSVTMMWFDERADNGFFCYRVRNFAEFDSFFRQFGTAEICPHEYRVTYLPMMLQDMDSPTFIYVTASAGPERVGDFISASRGVGAEYTEILLFDPRERFLDSDHHGRFVDFCKRRFEENKISMTVVSPSWTGDVI